MCSFDETASCRQKPIHLSFYFSLFTISFTIMSMNSSCRRCLRTPSKQRGVLWLQNIPASRIQQWRYTLTWLEYSLALSLCYLISLKFTATLPVVVYISLLLLTLLLTTYYLLLTTFPFGGEYRIRTDDPLLAKQVL